jgi:hypothetical protein
MTNIHVWAPLRLKFEGLQEVLQTHPNFRNGKFKNLVLHYRAELTSDHLYSIFTTALLERHQKSVHILAYDDDELEEGCGLETLDVNIKHLVNLTKVHPKLYFLFADFIDYLYGADATYTHYEITHFKNTTYENVRVNHNKTFYKDFRGFIDGTDCDCYNNPNEEGMKKICHELVKVLLERAPQGAF